MKKRSRSTTTVTPILGEGNWISRNWRPYMAVVYIIICILDYIIRPSINYYEARKFDLGHEVQYLVQLEPTAQMKTIEILSSGETIPPILPEFVHLAFGAIAWTRGRERIERVRQLGGIDPYENDVEINSQVTTSKVVTTSPTKPDNPDQG
jgi:hypothetical protein